MQQFLANAYWNDLLACAGPPKWAAGSCCSPTSEPTWENLSASPLAIRISLDPNRTAPFWGTIEVLADDNRGHGESGRRPIVEFPIMHPYPQLSQLAARHTARHSFPRIAVTGSNGKSTTCAMLHAVLPTPNVATEDNQNDEIGVPLTLLRGAPEMSSIAVEVGAYVPGDITAACELIRPDVGVVTQIGTNHLQRFGSVHRLFAAKCEVFSSPCGASLGVAPFDDPRFPLIAGSSRGRVYSFSRTSTDADSFLGGVERGDGALDIRAVVLGEAVRYRLPDLGVHFAVNSLAALTAAKLATGSNIGDAAQRLRETVFPPRRMEVWIDAVGRTVMDDSFNASSDSVEALASYLEYWGRDCAVLFGGILEGGEQADAIGSRALETLARISEHVVLYCAEGSPPGSGDGRFASASSVEEAIDMLISASVSTIVFKGSRGTGVWEVADEYAKRFRGDSSR